MLFSEKYSINLIHYCKLFKLKHKVETLVMVETGYSIKSIEFEITYSMN